MDEKLNEQEPTPLDLERVWELPKAGVFLTISPDTIKRNYPQWVVQLSRRRQGIKFRHVLQIAGGK
jgi:hypothetical protein